jgi:hypothetical protein
MAGVGLLVQTDPTAPVAPPAIVPLGDIALGLPLGVNVLVTALIIGRIWYVSRGTSRVLSMRSVQTAMAVVIESGALVVIAQIAFVTLFVTGSPAQNIAVAVAEQIYVSQHYLSRMRICTDRLSLVLTGHRADPYLSPYWHEQCHSGDHETEDPHCFLFSISGFDVLQNTQYHAEKPRIRA